MTISELEQSFNKVGLRGVCDPSEMNAEGEVRIVVTDADGHNAVSLRFPFQGLDDPGLPEALIELYFSEMKMRRAKYLVKKGKIK